MDLATNLVAIFMSKNERGSKKMIKPMGFNLQLFAEEGTAPEGGGDSGANGNDGVLSGESGDNPTNTGANDGLLSGDGQKENKGDQTDKQGQEENKDGQGAEGQKEKDQKPEGAPETYEDFKAPEGITFDDAVITEFKEVAKGLNLPQAAAQKLVEFQAQLVSKQQQGLIDAHNQMAATWKAETMKAYNQEELADAVRGFKNAPKEVQQILSEYKLENNKAFVGFFSSLGKGQKEDNFENGEQKKPTEKSAASVLYPELAK